MASDAVHLIVNVHIVFGVVGVFVLVVTEVVLVVARTAAVSLLGTVVIGMTSLSFCSAFGYQLTKCYYAQNIALLSR
jgi:hypothetical protein